MRPSHLYRVIKYLWAFFVFGLLIPGAAITSTNSPSASEPLPAESEHQESLLTLVDTEPEDMAFRFRTKFDRNYDPDQDTRVLIAPKITIPPLLDGFLDDGCWKAEGPQSAWKHRTHSAWVQAATTDISPKQTVVSVCYDEKNLYLAYVAEEPIPKSIFFVEKRGRGSDGFEAYGSDSCEMFLETDGLGGDGHMWQFIFNIYPNMLYEGINPWTAEGEAWNPGARCKGAMGPKRWIVELAIPFDGFKWGDYAYKGPPKRGERWGIRSVRNGGPVPFGEKRMASTWTYNPIHSWHNPWPTGVLIFEDPNLLRNGKFNEDLDGNGQLDFWKAKKSNDALEAALTFDEKAGLGSINCKLTRPEDLFQVSQTVGVRPNKFYRLTGRIKIEKGVGKVTVGFTSPARSQDITKAGEWQDIDVEAYASGAQENMVCYILVQGNIEKALIDHLLIEQEPYGIEKGTYCLTGNGFRPDLNVRDKWNIKGRYTYLNPATGEFQPPKRVQWSDVVANGADDVGIKDAVDGWIPFEKGSLTKGGHNMIQWPANPFGTHLEPVYPAGHEIVFDLGRDFFFTGVDCLFPAAIHQIMVYVKPEKSKEYVLIDKMNGAGVLDPVTAALYYRARELDSVARYVKLHWFEDGYTDSQFFCQLWGQEKGSHADLEVKRFQWKKGIRVEKPKVPSLQRVREPLIWPHPQQVAWTGMPFKVVASPAVQVGQADQAMTPLTQSPIASTNTGSASESADATRQTTGKATKIVYAEAGLTPGIAADFSDDTFEIHGVRLPVVSLTEELKSNPELNHCIVVGDAANAPEMAGIAQKAGLNVTPADPGEQGYVLSVNADRVLIVGSGSDQNGAFYGITSVMQIMRRDAEGNLIVPGCLIRDWPKAGYRATMFYFQNGLRLPEEYKKIISLYSMIRVNGTRQSSLDPNPYDPKAMKIYNELRGYLRRHFIMTQDSFGGAGRGDAGGGLTAVEMMDDEDETWLRQNTMCSRFNVCPSSAHGYYALRWGAVGSYDSPEDGLVLGLDLDEMAHIGQGSRWLSDRRCLKRNLDGGRLLYEYICRYYDMARQYGLKTDLIDCMLTKDCGTDDFMNMIDAYPKIPFDQIMGSWKGSIGKSYSNPEYAVDHFDLTYTYNDWGYGANYGDPYGGPNPDFKQTTDRRIWGTLSCFWGGCNNDAFILGLLGKIVGGQCMCGDLSLPVMTEYLWSPANPMPNTLEFMNRLITLTVRLNERYFRRPFPSYEDTRNPKWFFVDIAQSANWSHIDEIPFDGYGWLDFGPTYDYSLLPMGDVKFEEVPFRVLDPKKNNNKSVIFIANYPPGSDIAPVLPAMVPEIPVNKKIASLCFLKTRVGGGIPASYVAVYEDGRRLTFNIDVRDLEVAATYTWDRPHNYENMKQYKAIGRPNPLAMHVDFMSRPAWFGYTPSGDECSLRIHEWVNPYPELTVKSIRIFYPPCQVSTERTAVFAVTGIEAEQRDIDRWAKKDRPPLLPPPLNIDLNNLRPVIAGGAVETRPVKVRGKDEPRPTNRYLDQNTNVVCEVKGTGSQIFNDDCYSGGVGFGKSQVFVEFTNPVTAEAMALRGRFMTYKFEGDSAAGTFKLALADYTISVQTADGKWHTVGELKGAAGEDDNHYVRVPSLTIKQIRIDVDSTPYPELYGSSNPGLSFIQVYSKKQ